MRLPLLIGFLLVAEVLSAQSSDAQLAQHYLNSGEFDKALLYFENLYEQNPSSEYYNGLLRSYLELGDYKEAERLVKKHGKIYSSNLLHLDLGDIYKAQGQLEEAREAYTEAIEDLPPVQGMVIRTANEFIKRDELELALHTYERGKKILDDRYPFSYEMASLYGAMGDTQKMIEAYLELIAYNDAYLQTVQNALVRSIDFEEDTEKLEILRTELLRRVQRSPENVLYAEMVTWLFLQKKDFNSAFIQMKALDKRLNDGGRRMLNLAALCVNNEAFDVAQKCYQYVVDQGADHPYYSYALQGVVSMQMEQLTSDFPLDSSALKRLHQRYEATLDELGRSVETVSSMREKASLEAWYLGDLLAANRTLNSIIELPGLPPEARAEVKLDLAKVLIARGYLWDASLLASQVDKDFKNDVLGYKGKFLNAQISYYTGDFEWAQAQLDILKGSTSKLISNDAMDLSLLITDNLNLDTVLDPMLRFARADLLIAQHKFQEALLTFDSLAADYPQHALSDDMLMKRAQIAGLRGEYAEALKLYERVLADYYFEITADNALYKMGLLAEEKLGDEALAQRYYKQLLLDFPGSLFVTDARKRFRKLRGELPTAVENPIIPTQERVP